MTRRMLSLLIVVITALGLSLVSAQSASAFNGNEWLGCRISPNTTSTYTNPCQSSSGLGGFTIYFQVQSETAPSTYSWTINSAGDSAGRKAGCTSSTNYCTLYDQVCCGGFDNVTATVTLTQGLVQKTLTAYAHVQSNF
jgi:hypothetical protein